MKRRKSIDGAFGAIAVALICTFMFPSAHAAEWYVDAVNGDDSYDGNEKAYYYRAETGDFFRATVRILSRFAELLEPRFRDRYRMRVRASAGFYMDNYVQKDPSQYHYLPPTKGGSQVDRFLLAT